MRWRKDRRERVDLDAQKIEATRAMYIDEDIQRVEMTIETSDNYRVVITMTPRQARQLLEQLTMSYHAINPPLRTRTETFGN